MNDLAARGLFTQLHIGFCGYQMSTPTLLHKELLVAVLLGEGDVLRKLPKPLVNMVHPKNAYLPFQIYMDLYIYDKRI